MNDLALYQPAALDRNPAAVYLASLSESGRRTMASKLKRAAGVLGFRDLALVPWGDLRFQHLAAIRSKLLDEEKLAPASVNVILAALKGVARAAFNLGALGAEDYYRLKDVKCVRGSALPCGRDLEPIEIDRLLRASVGDGAAGARDAAAIAVLFATGMRRSECAGLDVIDYAPATGALLVRGKGHKERKAWISGATGKYVREWLDHRGNEPGALFCPVDRQGRVAVRRMSSQAIYNLLVKRARRAGLRRRFSPHDLRRTFVGSLLDAGADLSTVQGLAGHASPLTTARYDRRGDEARRRAAALLSVRHHGGHDEDGDDA